MEKTIEQQIAEGVAQGIQKAKEQETELRKQKAKETASGYVVFFVSWFLTMCAYVSIKLIFGFSKEFSHNYSYPIIAVLEIAFMYLFLRQELKTQFFGTVLAIALNAFGIGYLMSIGL